MSPLNVYEKLLPFLHVLQYFLIGSNLPILCRDFGSKKLGQIDSLFGGETRPVLVVLVIELVSVENHGQIIVGRNRVTIAVRAFGHDLHFAHLKLDFERVLLLIVLETCSDLASLLSADDHAGVIGDFES